MFQALWLLPFYVLEREADNELAKKNNHVMATHGKRYEADEHRASLEIPGEELSDATHLRGQGGKS